MRYEIILAPEAIDDVRRLPAYARSLVRDAMAQHLRHTPAKTSKSRIKRLRGPARPQFRLRVGDIRVFYDVRGSTVEVLAVVLKDAASRWLHEEGSA